MVLLFSCCQRLNQAQLPLSFETEHKAQLPLSLERAHDTTRLCVSLYVHHRRPRPQPLQALLPLLPHPVSSMRKRGEKESEPRERLVRWGQLSARFFVVAGECGLIRCRQR